MAQNDSSWVQEHHPCRKTTAHGKVRMNERSTGFERIAIAGLPVQLQGYIDLHPDHDDVLDQIQSEINAIFDCEPAMKISALKLADGRSAIHSHLSLNGDKK